MYAIYSWIWDCMLSVWYENFFISLPFACLYDCVWFLPLRWSSTLLMWADVRTSGSGNNNRDAAIWWDLGRLSGSLWGPQLLEPSSSSSSFSRSWRVFVSRLGLWSLFLLVWICWSTVYVIFQNSVLSGYFICGVLFKLILSVYLGRYNNDHSWLHNSMKTTNM